ncbi:MAG TPA: M81 family metallopeptidase, partial [Thermomicrobiales bacterium]|nr:M81 family metallopeptidase [Thermomicrobiales bacterium]
ISSAGPLAADSWDAIRTEFLDAIRAAGPVDAAFFAMHGAMCAENEIDPEGALLVGAREILGPNTSIVVSLDLHGIVTDRMLESVDAAVAYHTYPHNDFYETGARGAELLLRIARGEVRPVMAMVRIPALVRGDELITESGLIGARIRECQALEASGQALAAAMFWGNPFTDVPDLCSNSLVVTDNDPVGAEAAARDLAARFWVDRAAMQAPLVSLEEAVRIASETEGTTILVDAADATSSGASGDSNAVLRALIEFGYKGSSLHPIVDAPAVSEAMHAGIGNTIEITIGGTVDPERFTPLPVRATVRMLSDGRHTNESHNTETYGGRTAVLEIGHHTVIATSRAVSLYDRSLFLAHGQDPTRFDVVVQKSPHCQHRFFADWATRLVGVDAPGSTSANLPYLGHTRCARPMYPMELDTEFHPEANLFHA